jgi:hypothetical protein
MTCTCPRESSTQHYLGGQQGFGPVTDTENVIFAVFEKTPKDNRRLITTALETKQLKRGEISLARQRFISAADFESFVVVPMEQELGKIVGVAMTTAGILRGISYIVQGASPPLEGRAICVLDKVSQRDYNAHAALEFCESLNRLTPKQKGTTFERIKGDIVDALGDIIPLASAFSLSSPPKPISSMAQPISSRPQSLSAEALSPVFRQGVELSSNLRIGRVNLIINWLRKFLFSFLSLFC